MPGAPLRAPRHEPAFGDDVDGAPVPVRAVKRGLVLEESNMLRNSFCEMFDHSVFWSNIQRWTEKFDVVDEIEDRIE